MTATAKTRTEDCDRGQALVRLEQAEAFVAAAQLVLDGGEADVATPGVAAALAVLAGIAAADAACCATLKVRARGPDHREAVALLGRVHPHGKDMAKDLQRLLSRKDDAHYGLHMVGAGDATKMVGWARRATALARDVLEAS